MWLMEKWVLVCLNLSAKISLNLNAAVPLKSCLVPSPPLFPNLLFSVLSGQAAALKFDENWKALIPEFPFNATSTLLLSPSIVTRL